MVALDEYGIPSTMRWPCLSNFSLHKHPEPIPQTVGKVGEFYAQLREDEILYRSFFSSPKWNCRKGGQHCNDRLPLYIEIGANSGTTDSNTLFFQETLGWQGVLIEGQSEHCLTLEQHRCHNGVGNVIACGAACRPEAKGEIEFVKMGYMSGSLAMGSIPKHFHDWNTSDRRKDDKSWGTVMKVPCAPFNSILSRARLRHRVDFFSLDVEGSEYRVLESINWNTFRFGILLIEIRCPHDPVDDAHNRTRLLLSLKGYTYLDRIAMNEVWGDMRLDWVRDGLPVLRKKRGSNHCGL